MAKNSEKADAAYAEALKRIEECGNQRKCGRDLTRLGLTTPPTEIGQLTALTTLDLRRNLLTTMPEIL